MDPTKIRNWALAITACAAVLGPALMYTHRLVAQEAARQAEAVVEQKMAPATKELEQIKELLRRQEDRDAFRACMDYAHQDEPTEIRNQICTRESNRRWAWWKCEDETPGQCGPQP